LQERERGQQESLQQNLSTLDEARAEASAAAAERAAVQSAYEDVQDTNASLQAKLREQEV
jgi:hypothetical protein